MKQSLLFMFFASSFLQAMEHSVAIIVIQKDPLILLNKVDLKGRPSTIFTDKAVIDDGKTLCIKLLPNQNGQT